MWRSDNVGGLGEHVKNMLWFLRYRYTVNPFMFACPLFHEFRELNETAKLKGMNIDIVATSTGITHVLELCGLNSPK